VTNIDILNINMYIELSKFDRDLHVIAIFSAILSFVNLCRVFTYGNVQNTSLTPEKELSISDIRNALI